MNYVGIRGHRGAGKNSVAFLIGNTIQWLIDEKKCPYVESYDEAYTRWVKQIMNDEKIIHSVSLSDVYFDSFADTLKLFVELITGIPHDYIYDDYYKDHVVINLRDFSYKVYDEIPEDLELHTREELYNKMPRNGAAMTIMKNMYITMREFILYFGIEVMQRFFGLNVWVKSLKQNEERFNSIFDDDNSYKIYTDVKTPSEVTYILEKNGVIVHVTRPTNRKKSGGFDKLSRDGRIDYTIHVGGSLYQIKSQIFEVAKQIIEKNNGKG